MTLCIWKKKWNESGFRPPLCTYRLNWARRTSWGWWDDWDDTVLQTQDSKFEPWRSEAEHATSRSRRLPTILTFTRGWGRNNFVSFKPPRPGTEPRTLAWKAVVLTTTLGPPPLCIWSLSGNQLQVSSEICSKIMVHNSESYFCQISAKKGFPWWWLWFEDVRNNTHKCAVLLINVSSDCFARQTQNICISFEQRRSNVLYKLYKCYTNVIWLLWFPGIRDRKHGSIKWACHGASRIIRRWRQQVIRQR